MKSGMLWFDDSPRTLKIRMQEAVNYYSEKYGETPTLCFVNPSMLADKVKASNGVEVKGSRIVMPGHFWLGVGTVDLEKSNGRDKPAGMNGRASSSRPQA